MSEAFISRWSRRKQEAKTAIPADAPPLPLEEKEGLAPEPPSPELPSIDSLGAESDYSGFLQPGVSPALRQQALVKLWASSPGLMAPETMDLHMGDYSGSPAPELVKTAWRLGKGVLDAAELAAEEEEAKAKLEDQDS